MNYSQTEVTEGAQEGGEQINDGLLGPSDADSKKP